jgi:hypothetical protein
MTTLTVANPTAQTLSLPIPAAWLPAWNGMRGIKMAVPAMMPDAPPGGTTSIAVNDLDATAAAIAAWATQYGYSYTLE